MGINTTVHMKPWLRAKIFKVSESYKISKSKIIELLLLKIMHNTEIEPCMFESVKYQEKNKLIKWKNLHVSYDENYYEMANDLKKVLKKSVSKIIAEGIEQFLDEIVRDLSKNKKSIDNYLSDYIFTSATNKKIYYFTIFWNLPPLNNQKKE